jgi:hypothetical protein
VLAEEGRGDFLALPSGLELVYVGRNNLVTRDSSHLKAR